MDIIFAVVIVSACVVLSAAASSYWNAYNEQAPPPFPDCITYDEYCRDIHVAMYDDVDDVEIADFQCVRDEDCVGAASTCNVENQTCTCGGGRGGAACSIMHMYSRKWRWMVLHDTRFEDGTGITDFVTNLSLFVPANASNLVKAALMEHLPTAEHLREQAAPKFDMAGYFSSFQQRHPPTLVSQYPYPPTLSDSHPLDTNELVSSTSIPESSSSTLSNMTVTLRLPPQRVFNGWFRSEDSVLDYLEELVQEWSLVQNVAESERDQLTMEKLYAEFQFVILSYVAAHEDSSVPPMDISHIVAAAVDGVHNAVIWAVKNSLRFYDVGATSRYDNAICSCAAATVCLTSTPSLPRRNQALREGSNFFHELVKVLCHIGDPASPLPFIASANYVTAHEQVLGPHTLNSESSNQTLLARAARLGLLEEVTAILQLRPQESTLQHTMSLLGSWYPDASGLHNLLREFTTAQPPTLTTLPDHQSVCQSEESCHSEQAVEHERAVLPPDLAQKLAFSKCAIDSIDAREIARNHHG